LRLHAHRSARTRSHDRQDPRAQVRRCLHISAVTEP